MKIGILMQEIQTLGGVQRVVTTMFNRLADDERYYIYILAPKGNRSKQFYPVNNKIKIINYKSQNKAGYISRIIKKLNRETGCFRNKIFENYIEKIYFPEDVIAKYIKIIKQEKIDVIIGAGAYYAILAAKIKKYTNIKCIGWMHSTFDGYFNTPGNSTFALFNLFDKYSPYIDKLLVLTKIDKIYFYNNCKGLMTEPIVLYNPLTLNAELNSYNNFDNLLYVGRITFNTKGTDRLLLIMQEVIKEYPQIKLYIVGDGQDYKKLARHIQKMRLEKNILLCGASDCVGEYYQKCSLLLLPSRIEGFGLVITEAFAHGLPVIAFHSNGPDEIIDDSLNGYLLNQGDIEGFANSIIKLLSDKSKYLSFSNSAVLRARDFNLDVILNQMVRILEN